MIDIKDKKECCGCNACVQACPLHCISMEADEEGFWYPKADSNVCIKCGKCDVRLLMQSIFKMRMKIR